MFASRQAIPQFGSFCNPYNDVAARVCYRTQGLESVGIYVLSVCHCRQSSMLNDIGGARTRTVFNVINTTTWSDIFSVIF